MAGGGMGVEDARYLLGCRVGACGPEIQAAFRRRLKELRPDLDRISGEELVRLREARTVLLAVALPDRRRRKRTKASVYRRGMRRSTWTTSTPADPRSVNAYL